jgi:hypothetical protein
VRRLDDGHRSNLACKQPKKGSTGRLTGPTLGLMRQTRQLSPTISRRRTTHMLKAYQENCISHRICRHPWPMTSRSITEYLEVAQCRFQRVTELQRIQDLRIKCPARCRTKCQPHPPCPASLPHLRFPTAETRPLPHNGPAVPRGWTRGSSSINPTCKSRCCRRTTHPHNRPH